MICARCNELIQAGEATEVVVNPGATGVGADIEIHADPCDRAPQQTAPTRR